MPQRAVETGDVIGAHETSTSLPGYAPGRSDGSTAAPLDVQHVDADLVGEVLHGGVSESQAHRERHARPVIRSRPLHHLFDHLTEAGDMGVTTESASPGPARFSLEVAGAQDRSARSSGVADAAW